LLKSIKEKLLTQEHNFITFESKLQKQLDAYITSESIRDKLSHTDLVIENNEKSSASDIKDYQIETNTFIFRKEVLTYTITGFPIELITITGHSTRHYPLHKREFIFITARVHGGESWLI
jgi:preprotein translocase subunit Sec63